MIGNQSSCLGVASGMNNTTIDSYMSQVYTEDIDKMVGLMEMCMGTG